MLEGFATLKRLATSPPPVVPAPDLLVLQDYPVAKPRLDGLAVRLDADLIRIARREASLGSHAANLVRW
jgi:hypothetical protein